MPAASPPSAPPVPATSNALVWAEGLLCGGLVALLPPTALLLGVLLLPAIVAVVLEHQPGKPVARSVVLCGLAASVTPVRALWAAGHDLAASIALATDANVVGTAWSAAAAGWLLAELMPLGVRAGLEALSLSRAARLRAARETLIAGWGPEAAPPPNDGPAPGR